MSESSSAFSFGRLFKAILPILAVAVLVNFVFSNYEQTAKQNLENDMLSRLLGDTLKAPSTTIPFTDEDGDLLSDPAADTTAPEKLVFTYIASAESAEDASTWKDLTDALAEATELPVEFVAYATLDEQLTAMAKGELHLAGLSTGSVPTGVEYAGFHPICTFGSEDGSFGYTMKLIAPAKQAVESLDALAGKKILFTSPNSNSGFKAALIHLMAEEKLLPERDYEWSFTFNHETSIKNIAEATHDAAAVASDILERMTNDGEVAEADFAVLYESERFPPATLGLSNQLPEELRTKLAETLLAFDWAGTSVEEKYGSSGATQFVSVNYKDDWANIRRIDEAVRQTKTAE